MNKEKILLKQFAEVGVGLSDELRSALMCGVLAIEFKQRVVAALNQTGAAPPSNAPSALAETPAARAPAGASTSSASAPRRWSQDEDKALQETFRAQMANAADMVTTVAELAQAHSRTPYAIAVRLSKQFGLLTEAEVATVRAMRFPVASLPAAPAAPKAEEAAANAAVNAVLSADAEVADYDDSVPGAGHSAPRQDDDDIPWGAESSADQIDTELAPDEAPASAAVVAEVVPEVVAEAVVAEAVVAEAAPEVVAEDAAKEAPPLVLPPHVTLITDGPDYASLLETELSLAPPEARKYASYVLARFHEQPDLRNSVITLLSGSERARERLPHALRMAMLQRVEMQPEVPAA